MTGPQHYETAENLLTDASALFETDPGKARFKQAAAHTHAMLAGAAAAMDQLNPTDANVEAWALVLS